MKKRAKFILIGITLVIILVGVFASIALAADSPAATGDSAAPGQGQCVNGACPGQCANAGCPNSAGGQANCPMSGAGTGGCSG
jgi:hypothetical protein